MNCDQLQQLLDSYVDRELDLLKCLEVEQHLQGCAACAERHRELQALRASLHRNAPYHRPSSGLRSRIQAAIGQPAPGRRATAVGVWYWWALSGVTAALMLSLIITLTVLNTGAGRNRSAASEVVANHVRSMMAGHITDIASSDRHTVRPWFNGRLDFSPPVKDLTGQGFPLVGGRLEYLQARPVAALVYRHRKHVINLYIWPAEQRATGERHYHRLQGYRLVKWNQGGLAYWAVSDLNAGDLNKFTELIRTH